MTNSLQESINRLRERVESGLFCNSAFKDDFNILLDTCQRVLDVGKEIEKRQIKFPSDGYENIETVGFNACHDLFTALIAKEYVRKECFDNAVEVSTETYDEFQDVKAKQAKVLEKFAKKIINEDKQALLQAILEDEAFREIPVIKNKTDDCVPIVLINEIRRACKEAVIKKLGGLDEVDFDYLVSRWIYYNT